MSEREPELGLGVVASVDVAAKRVGIAFPATGEQRLYALDTPVLKRVVFRVGESIANRQDLRLTIEAVEDDGGVLTYVGGGVRLREDEVSDVTTVASPPERLLAGQCDPSDVFDLRYRALQARARRRSADVRGFLGGRVELIPHQFYILHEVAARQIPRVLLADEVGLGKTIEACLIVQRLLAVGQVRRVLVLVPESLTHQWFVELLRRFNLWFSIYDEGRCAALEASDPGENPFLASQLALASVDFLTQMETRRDQAIAAGWDLVIVDEAHHLVWTPERASPEYALVEALAQRAPGLLLLTATPTQLGQQGHFARLRLLDPSRYDNYDRFVAEAEQYAAVAGVAEKIVGSGRLTAKDQATLRRVFTRDPERLAQHLAGLKQAKAGARESLLRSLLDQHGTGRVMFRNTRAAMQGFPKRRYCPVELADPGVALHARIARELAAEEAGTDGTLRYAFKEDPRLEWLVGFLQAHREEKALLICRTQRKVVALEHALQEKRKVKVALFHEGLPLVQRDRHAAWFAEPDGAQLLICSEIGSEGRNFQFAHHLVFFDLPLNPGLIEQRIGRLDRIGQTQPIQIHVPYVAGSADGCVAEWYHRGLDAFETPLHGGEEYQAAFKARLLEVALAYGSGKAAPDALAQLVAETAAFREKLAAKMKQGRDRLLELNSFRPDVAETVLERVRAADADRSWREFLVGLLDHFGVRVKEHDDGDLFLDPSHAYVESFPSIPADGMLATFDRQRALAREDIRFLSADHPLLGDAIDLLVDSPAGTTAFGRLTTAKPGLLLEAVFVLETVAETRWRVDQFLAPTPVRVVVDVRGQEVTAEHDLASLEGYIEDADLHRFLELPAFSGRVLKAMLAAATNRAEVRGAEITGAASARAQETLAADVQRLADLRKLNDHVRPEEVTQAGERLERTSAAIAAARLRLDSLRLILAGA